MIEGLSLEEAENFVNNSQDAIVYEEAIEPILLKIIERFDSHSVTIAGLLNFDQLLLDFCIGNLKKLEASLKTNHEVNITSIHLLPTSTIRNLEMIKENNSFKPQFQKVYSQSLVLLVSYFTSILKEMFVSSVNFLTLFDSHFALKIQSKVKFEFRKLAENNFDLRGKLGDIIIDKESYSFQDMKSSKEAFNKYFNFEISRNKDQDIIIMGQALRHAIVHNSEVVDSKFLNQTRDCQLENHYELNDEIVLEKKDVINIQVSMKKFLLEMKNELITKLRNDH
ncbi:hypothetical protein [Portibacter lacus]|uniref:hypothetical protein n=1 Tax=Portibacter lacus TaxID=1099794 RepID=UPI001F216CC5